MGLISQVTIVLNGLLFGWLSDRFKVWKLIILNLILFAACLALFIIYIATVNIGFQIGYVGAQVLNQNIYMLCLIMLGRVARPDSRGTLYASFALLNAIGNLLVNKLGSDLYQQTPSHSLIFLISAGVYAVFMMLVVFFGFCGKLTV